MHLLMHLFPCTKAANMTCKQSMLRTAWLWLNKNNSSVSASPLAQSYSLEMFWKNKVVTTTQSIQSSALRHRGGGISGRNVVTRALPEDGVSPPRAGSSCTPSFQEQGGRMSLAIRVGPWARGSGSLLTCRLTWMLLGPKVVVP